MLKRSFCAATLVLSLLLLPLPSWSAFRPDVRPGYGVTKLGWLSDYHPPLKGTNSDTPVFFLDSGKPGATALLIGGTHPREIAGFTAAAVAIENAVATEGRLIVIPALNASGYGISDLSTTIPRQHAVQGRSGTRLLPYGDRRIAASDQVADGKKFVHLSGYEIDDPAESRNINRNYPGKADGTTAEQVAFAVMELVRGEEVHFSLDLHEANTPGYYLDRRTGSIEQGSRLAYMLVSNPKPEAFEIAAESILQFEADTTLPLKLEQSNPAFRGLSHLEIGNASKCLSFLMETPNPGQDQWREAPDVTGDVEYPLKHRVGVHLELFKQLCNAYGANSKQKLTLDNLPGLRELENRDVSHFLN